MLMSAPRLDDDDAIVLEMTAVVSHYEYSSTASPIWRPPQKPILAKVIAAATRSENTTPEVLSMVMS